jgi:hypothetical protein
LEELGASATGFVMERVEPGAIGDDLDGAMSLVAWGLLLYATGDVPGFTLSQRHL